MAKDKKSFLMYADLLPNIDHLTNEEKGILFNHLLEYVNDMNPILEDRLILTAWKPLERQLKRDLEKFEEVKDERSKNGQMGNLKRYNLDLYKRVQCNDLTMDEALNLAKGRLARIEVAPLSPPLAKLADNVNENVNVNVNDISNIDIETNLNLFSEDVPTPAKTKTKRKTKDKVKAESVTDEQFEKYKKFLELFNANFKGSNFRGRRVDVVDFMICLETYNELEILNAVRNHNQNFWIQDLTPQSLFRTTTRGGGVAADVIGQLLLHKQIKKHI